MSSTSIYNLKNYQQIQNFWKTKSELTVRIQHIPAVQNDEKSNPNHVYSSWSKWDNSSALFQVKFPWETNLWFPFKIWN